MTDTTMRTAGFLKRWQVGKDHEDQVLGRIGLYNWHAWDVRMDQDLPPGMLKTIRLRCMHIPFIGVDFIAWRPPDDIVIINAKTSLPRDEEPLPGLGRYTISTTSLDNFAEFMKDNPNVPGYFVLGDFTCITWRDIKTHGRKVHGYWIIDGGAYHGTPWEQVFGLPGGEWPGDWPQAA